MPNTDDYIGVVISDVARLLRTAFDRRVRELGITRAQWLMLTRLHRHPGVSQSELADITEIDGTVAQAEHHTRPVGVVGMTYADQPRSPWFRLAAGQSYQVADDDGAHRSHTDKGARLFIVD